MKCTNRMRLLCTLCVAAIFLNGCVFGKSETVEDPYQVYTYNNGGYKDCKSTSSAQFFAQDLCVTNNVDYGTDQVASHVAEGAGVFNLDTKEVLYSQNLFGKLNPASTTKILTAEIIIRYGNLDDMVTVSANAVDLPDDSALCHLSEGDVISVRQLLNGLLLVSGNDAAIALAEYYSGSVEAFAEVMNEEAKRIGATNSHFMNPHGLTDEMHYTTIYDMHLIMQEAIELQEFTDIIAKKDVEVTFQNKNGEPVTKLWTSTNKYITGGQEMPSGVQVLGGKTGTTFAAGYCLVLYAVNKQNERIISIVYKADCRNNLYLLQDQILSTFAN